MATEEGLHWATLVEQLRDVLPGELAVVQHDHRRSWAELDDRAARVATALGTAGLRPGSRVAQYLYNSPAYVETWLGALKARAVPINVNFRYRSEELRYILDDAGAEALVYHASLRREVEAMLASAPPSALRLLVEIDDDAEDPTTPVSEGGAVTYADLLATHSAAAPIRRSTDDLVMTYTGGTTGFPKGVTARIGASLAGLLAAVPQSVGSPPLTTIDEAVVLAARLRDENRRIVTLPACPLMHGTGMVIGMQTGLLLGGAIALLRGRPFDAGELWTVADREHVTLIAIVGDPFARPMLAELRHAHREGVAPALADLRLISSSGAMFSHEVRAGLLELLPHVTAVDYLSATEGLMGVAISTHDKITPTGQFRPGRGVQVLDEQDQPVEPGSGTAGRLALSLGVPDCYHGDEIKSASTFRVVDGTRCAIPGDWATLDADGSLLLLGRGSNCINTGGEKVFPEEVEEAIKQHASIDDCLVFGLDDERFGQRVVAVAAPVHWPPPAPELVLDDLRRNLAGFKVPKQITFVPVVPRTASGKADYATARASIGD